MTDFLLNWLEHRRFLTHDGVEVVAMHVHIQVPIFSIGQLFGGEGCEQASGTLGLFAVLVIGMLAGGGAGKNHEESPG
jgi:hypothetical protein